MKSIYDNVSASCSKITTKAYSTSFSLGIKFLSPPLRRPIYGIYGFVRLADEIVDSFHDFDKKYLITKFRADTIEAIEQRISINPILNSFQEAVWKYNIEWSLIDTFLKSMEMDIVQQEHDSESYSTYILGSAEVVGLMCLRVFTEGNFEMYDKLLPFAMKLGSAFQKVNFLRDIKDDYQILGRNYFPGINFECFSANDKEEIQNDIELEFTEALVGIKQLPKSSRRGVYLAYYYYKKLFNRIKQTPVERVMNERIRITDANKISLMFKSMVRHQLDLL